MALNKIGFSQRCTGTVDKNGYVKINKILSYDIVGVPGFSGATFDFLKELKRKELLNSRREKINRLNNLQD